MALRSEKLHKHATPPEATRALLSVEKFTGDIWEPACGNGAISEVLKASGHIVHSTDLILRGYEDERLDFLKTTTPLARNIITNPPYGKHGLARRFYSQSTDPYRQNRWEGRHAFEFTVACPSEANP